MNHYIKYFNIVRFLSVAFSLVLCFSISSKALAATTFTFTGPTSGSVNAASTAFTVTPNGVYTGTITATPSGGGLSTPIVLTFSSSASPQTFTITPTAAGTVTLTPSNNGSLTNPANLSYTANAVVPGAPTSVTATAGNTQAAVSFTAPASNGGAAITGYTVTSSGGGTDTNAGTTALTHTVTGLTNGTSYTFTVTATNSAGTGAASSPSNSVIPTISYTFTGPTSGNINSASTNFTITPNNPYTGTITLTPSGGGLSTPIVLTFASSTTPQTFTITPTAVGTVTLTPTNNGSLINPSNLSYTSNAVVPGAPTAVTAVAGNGQATVSFSAPASNGGATITGYTVTASSGGTDTNAGTTSLSHIITGLTNGTSYTFTVKATNSAGTSAASSQSNSVNIVVSNTNYLSGGGGITHVPGHTTINTSTQNIPSPTVIIPATPHTPVNVTTHNTPTAAIVPSPTPTHTPVNTSTQNISTSIVIKPTVPGATTTIKSGASGLPVKTAQQNSKASVAAPTPSAKPTTAVTSQKAHNATTPHSVTGTGKVLKKI